MSQQLIRLTQLEFMNGKIKLMGQSFSESSSMILIEKLQKNKKLFQHVVLLNVNQSNKNEEKLDFNQATPVNKPFSFEIVAEVFENDDKQ